MTSSTLSYDIVQLSFVVLFFLVIYLLMLKLDLGVFTSLTTVYVTLTLSNYVLGLSRLLGISITINIILMLAFALWMLYRKKAPRNSINFRISKLLEFTVLVIVTLLLFKSIPDDFVFKTWDEYASWGPNVKSLYFDRLLSTDFTINSNSHSGVYQLYPPGQPLIQYQILQIFPWSEKIVLFATNLFKLSLIMMVLEIAFKKRPYLTYIWAIPVLSMFVTYSLNFYSIYADSLLSIIFLGTLTTLFLPRNQTGFHQYLGLILTMLLAIIKPSSIFFIITLCIILLTINVSNKLRNKLRLQETDKPSNVLVSRRINLPTTLILASGIATELSWRVYCRLNLSSQALNPSNLLDPENISIKANLDRVFETLKVFRIKLQDIQFIFGFNLSTQLLLIALMFGTVISYRIKIINNKYKDLILGLFVGFVFYFAIIYYTYNFLTDEYERANGGSIIRYLSTYIVPWTISILLILLSINQNKITSYKVAVAGLFLTSQTLNLLTQEVNRFEVDQLLYDSRESMVKVTNFVAKTPGSVYLIEQGAQGMSKNMFTYLSMPNKINLWCWSIGEKIYEGDFWTCDKSELIKIRDFDYLYVLNNDGQITENGITGKSREESANLPLDPGLYKIEKANAEIYLDKTPVEYP
jgi:hypothetical protein